MQTSAILDSGPFRPLLREVSALARGSPLLARLYAYIGRYVEYHALAPHDLLRCYADFTGRYGRDMTAFAQTGRYPAELGRIDYVPTRVEYDVALLLSTVLTVHRYRLMELTDTHSARFARGAIVGCGPGITLVRDGCCVQPRHHRAQVCPDTLDQ